MYSEDGALSPGTASIRSISNYESEINIDPVDVGTQHSITLVRLKVALVLWQ